MREKLDSYAHDTVVWIYKDIQRTSLVDNIVKSYIDLTRSPEIKKLELRTEQLDTETQKKIFFEMLCFASFITSYLILKYVTHRKFFKKIVDEESAHFFNNRVRHYLEEICDSDSFSKIHDIGVTSIKPEIRVGPTEFLDSTKRLIEYAHAASQEKGKEIINFSKNVAKFLGREHYPLFEPLSASYTKPIIELAYGAMKGVFGH